MTKDEALQVLDGTMLGDGSLKRLKKGANFGMALSKPLVPRREDTELVRRQSLTEHLKYECWLSRNMFGVLGVRLSEGYPKVLAAVSKGRLYQRAYLQTRLSPLLGELYGQWYVDGEWSASATYGRYIRGARKIVPQRIMQSTILPTLTLTHWFLQDGGSSWRSSRGGPLFPRVTISSDGFTIGEVHHLTAMLNAMGVNTIRHAHQECVKGSGLKIYLAQDSIDLFMNLVEPHILEIFEDSVGPSYKDMVKHKFTPGQAEVDGRMSKIIP